MFDKLSNLYEIYLHYSFTLNVLNCSIVKKKAHISYNEQMARKLAFGNVFENWAKKSKLKSRGSSKESLSLSRKSGRSHESKSSLAKFSDTTRPCEIA